MRKVSLIPAALAACWLLAIPAAAEQAAKGAESALSCMMARTAAYKGHDVTWDEMMKSSEVWDPKIDLNKLT